jgi:hypothetical protein
MIGSRRCKSWERSARKRVLGTPAKSTWKALTRKREKGGEDVERMRKKMRDGLRVVLKARRRRV